MIRNRTFILMFRIMVDDDTFILYFYFNIWMFSMMDDNDTIILHLYLDGYCRIILCVFVM